MTRGHTVDRKMLHILIWTIREAAWYIISAVSVCLSEDNFRKPWRRKFIFAYSVYLQGIRVKFV